MRNPSAIGLIGVEAVLISTLLDQPDVLASHPGIARLAVEAFVPVQAQVPLPEAALRLLTPLHALTVYQWHTGNARDYFCPKCGIQSFRKQRGYVSDEAKAQGQQPFTGWAVNVRCLDGVDLNSIPIQHIAGSKLP